MKTIIIGGGHVGVNIASKLISEGHDITIIEKNEELKESLQSKLDALVICKDGVNVKLLKEIEIHKTDLFIAVTDSDKINIVACMMAKKLGKDNITIIGKIEHYFNYFNNKYILPRDFGIDVMISPKKLLMNKVLKLIEQPQTIEVIKYAKRQGEIIGLKIDENSRFLDITLKELKTKHFFSKDIKIMGIFRNSNILLPNDDTKILINDKIFLIGKTTAISKMLKNYSKSSSSIDNIILNSGSSVGRELTKHLELIGKRVIILERDTKICERISKELNQAIIINSSIKDMNVLDDLDLNNSCLVCISEDDEYNLLSSIYAKNHGINKTICAIKDSTLAPIVNNINLVDSVLISDMLTTSKILKYLRGENIIADSSISDIDAEAIGVRITTSSPVINQKIKNIKNYDKLIIGMIIRNDKVLIPNDDDIFRLNDRVILFVIPSAIKNIKKMFDKKFFFWEK